MESLQPKYFGRDVDRDKLVLLVSLESLQCVNDNNRNIEDYVEYYRKELYVEQKR